MIIRTPMECERIELRQFEEHDYDSFSSFMFNEKSQKYLPLLTKVTEERVHGLFRFAQNCYAPDSESIVLAIADKSTNEYMGLVGFTSDFDRKGVQVYFAVNEEYEGNGYEVEALKAVLPALKRQNASIKAYCQKGDELSAKVCEDAGMTFIEEKELSLLDTCVLIYKY